MYYSREGERQGFIFHLRPLQLDRIIIAAALAALDPKADLGLVILPNPLDGIARIDIGAGVALDLRFWEWILCGGRVGTASSLVEIDRTAAGCRPRS